MFKRFCLILSLAVGMVLFVVLPALAESVDTAWVRRYNGSGNAADYANNIAVDDSGNVYVTGHSWGTGINYDLATIKYYPNGDTAWLRRYNGPDTAYCCTYAIAIDDSGNVYVTGSSEGVGTSGDYATIKYYPNGDTAWVRRYNGLGNGEDEASAIVVDNSCNVYVTGSSEGVGTSGDYVTIKYYPNGETAWVRIYNGQGDTLDYAHAIAVDDSGNVYVTGWSHGSGTGEDYATIKYYPDGDTAWVRRYNGLANGEDAAFAVVVDDSGNVYVTGLSDGDGSHYDYATVKYDSSGNELWVKRYNGPGNDWDVANAIAVDGSGNLHVTGGSDGGGTCWDFTTIKYYPNGDTAWLRRYNGPENEDDHAAAIVIDANGDIYVTGYSESSATREDYATIKYDTSGSQLWVKTYNGPTDTTDYASAIAVDDSGNVYVTGHSEGGETLYDFATIKYIQTGTDVEDETGDREKPSEFALFQNYPNPFNQTTKITFTLARSGFASLNIYDILGRKVRTLISERLSSGYKSVLWDGKNDSGKDVASGTYFYQMRVENPAPGGVRDFTETKKLVLLK